VTQSTKPVTLRDVAAEAGVSLKTVSNVVNGYEFVADETRARVQAVIDAMGYRPNLAARNLRQARTGIIVLGVPSLRLPYFSELADQVLEVAQEFGWTTLVEQTGGDLERERALCAGDNHTWVDGVILSPLSADVAALRSRAGRPLVLLGERAREGTADHVAVDNIRAAQEATAYLLNSGRRRIAAIGAEDQFGSGFLRHAGYVAAHDEAGVDHDPVLVVQTGDYTRRDGFLAAEELIARTRDFDALFCFSDMLAMGALRALRQAGARVPTDVAVMGFDNVSEGEYSNPTLSTVAPDKRRLAEQAVQLLRERQDPASTSPPQEATVPHRLIIRESAP
jgi:DNA-binding LacI/PurR family transcriptional regulator